MIDCCVSEAHKIPRNRQLRKVIKNKASFPTVQSVKKCFTWPMSISPRNGPCDVQLGRDHQSACGPFWRSFPVMTFPAALLEYCSLRLACIEGVPVTSLAISRNALNPCCNSGCFSHIVPMFSGRSAAREDVCEVAKYTKFLTLLLPRFGWSLAF